MIYGTHSVSTAKNSSTKETEPGKERFSLPALEWRDEIIFLVSLSLSGLCFYPAYLIVFFLLLRSFKLNKYDFVIQSILIAGVYGFYRHEEIPFKFQDILFVISLIFMVFYRYTPVMKRITIAMLCYFAAIVFFAFLSDESMRIQFLLMRNYMMTACLFFPLAVFSGIDFDIRYFFRKIISYSLIISAFYVFDGFIYSGFFFLPGLKNYSDNIPTILNPVFELFTFPRRYPQGLYILALAIYPVIKYYRLSTAQWILIALAVISTRTMTFTAGLVFTFFIFQGKAGAILKYGLLCLAGLVLAYYADQATGGNLRVVSTIEQFTELENAREAEDASDFGSGRIAQFLPKYERMCDLGKEMTGLGFLHPEHTTNPKFIIDNHLYQAGMQQEVATGVEVTQLQTLLDMGYLGLIINTAFYILVYVFIRKLPHSVYYLSVLVAISIFGLGGFAGLSQTHGLLLLALTLSAIILSGRQNNQEVYEQ